MADCLHMSIQEQGLYSYASRWKKWGLDRLESEMIALEASHDPDGALRIMIMQFHGVPTTETKQAGCLKRGPKRLKALFKSRTKYYFSRDGGLTIVPSIKLADLTSAFRLPPLPRIGMSLRVPKRLARVQYYGLGPHENYRDRKASATKGIFSSTVWDMFEPYIVPSEYGGRENTEWMALTDDTSSSGVFVEALSNGDDSNVPPPERGLHMSVHPFTATTLEAARHTYDLGYDVAVREDPATSGFTGGFTNTELVEAIYLHVDFAHGGVGGECGWFPCVSKAHSVEASARISGTGNFNAWGKPLHIAFLQSTLSTSSVKS